MQMIMPHLWYDTQAREAANFYVSVFDDSRIKSITTLDETPSGSVDIVWFELRGFPFQAISAGPLFQFNPSISFFVTCSTKDEVDMLWNKLSEGGTALMELGEYPFSERYGWLQDRYGLSWQIGYMGAGTKPTIIPVLLFVGGVCGKAEEAVNFWTSVFPRSEVRGIMRYGEGEAPDREGTVKYASFTLPGQEFGAMDSAREHAFSFNEAISFMVYCDTQEEIDHYWEKLSAVPESEQCGWLKDRYGVSWQVVPAVMDEMLINGSKAQVARVTKAFLQMKKFDIAELQKAYAG